jgi:hypothetical protein
MGDVDALDAWVEEWPLDVDAAIATMSAAPNAPAKR